MMSPLKVLALLLGLTLGGASLAQGTATCTQWKYASNSGAYTGGFKSTPQEACTSTAQAMNAAIPSRLYTGTLIGTLPQCRLTFVTVPPGGGGTDGDSNPQTQVGSCTLPCPAAGTKRVINVTAGYTTSRNGSTDVMNLPSLVTRIGQNMCAASGGSTCTWTIGQPVDSWSSSQPTSTGLYRISDDWEMTSTGASCTPTSDETALTDSSAAVPGCPGAFGTVNGVPTCVQTGASTDKPASAPKNTAGNPASGSNGDDPLGSRSPSSGTNNGNNGSTPNNTDGTTLGPRGTGFPSGAGTTGGGSSPTSVEVNVETCGLPGKPPCKIDETGTPGPEASNGATSTDGLNGAFDTAVARIHEVTSPDGKDTSWGVTPTWFDSTSCSPFTLGTLPEPINREITFDICPVIPYVNGVMNFLWVVVTFFAIVSMTFRVMTSAKA